MRQNDVETRKALHDAGENQMRSRDRRFNRITEQVGQIKRIEAFVGRRAGMDKERKLAFAQDLPQRIEPLGGIGDVTGLGAHDHAGPAAIEAPAISAATSGASTGR